MAGQAAAAVGTLTLGASAVAGVGSASAAPLLRESLVQGDVAARTTTQHIDVACWPPPNHADCIMYDYYGYEEPALILGTARVGQTVHANASQLRDHTFWPNRIRVPSTAKRRIVWFTASRMKVYSGSKCDYDGDFGIRFCGDADPYATSKTQVGTGAKLPIRRALLSKHVFFKVIYDFTRNGRKKHFVLWSDPRTVK